MQGANLTYIGFSAVTETDAGTYQVVITNGFGRVTSSSGTLRVGTMPSITSHPTSLVVTQGQTAVFAVSATGSTPTSYQWTRNGADISSATKSSYTISNAVAASEATYAVKVSNAFGNVTSSNAVLAVLVPATITVHPISQQVFSGNSATFSVTATGTPPLGCQWFKNGVALVDGNNVLGANSNRLDLTTTTTNDSGSYRVTVSNDYGTDTSSVANLLVGVPPQYLSIRSVASNAVALEMAGSAGFAYVLEAATNVTPPVLWQAIATNTADSNGLWSCFDSNSVQMRFYRSTTQ